MKYSLWVIFTVVGIIVALFFLDFLNVSVGERRVKEAWFYIDGPNHDEASKQSVKAIKGLRKFPTVHGQRRDIALAEAREVLVIGLQGMFAEQYHRDMRFHPGPQWEICEARAQVEDLSICTTAAANATKDVAHRYFREEQGENAVALIKECVDYETREGIGDICRESAADWLADEAEQLRTEGSAPEAAEALRACIKTPDHWAPSQACFDDWYITVSRARNALVPDHWACRAILFYEDMPDGITAEDRQKAQDELDELRSKTALIETPFFYDTVEFAPVNKYWGRGEESTKYHLAQNINNKGYAIQWLEEEHPKGAWDQCKPAYSGKIEVHEARGRMVNKFHKECMTVRLQAELTLRERRTGQMWIKEDVEGTIPKGFFEDEETFIEECYRSRESSWQNAHDLIRDLDLKYPRGHEPAEKPEEAS
jgi:hypothetical protein